MFAVRMSTRSWNKPPGVLVQTGSCRERNEKVQTAPWWAVPVIAGSFLIIGGLFTFFYTWMHDRRQARRDLDWKLNEKTLEQSVAFVVSAKEVFDLPRPETQQELNKLLLTCEKIVNDMFFASAMLTYVGPKPVRMEAQSVFDRCYQVSVSKDPTEFYVLQESLPEAIEKFNHLVRETCGNRK
jgi:hypothetical protein